jgi:AcrR family transcriptional regulator
VQVRVRRQSYPNRLSSQRNVTLLRYAVKMGRPREHDERTGAALLDAAERIVEVGGLSALSVRTIADEVGTTTRAIYSRFGSKAGLISALGARTFDLLGAAVENLPVTDDPVADLVEAGVNGFRRLVIDHPALFPLGIQQTDTTPEQQVEIRAAAARAWTVLRARFTPLEERGCLGTRSVDEAATAFHALCEGLAALEVRGVLTTDGAEDLWRSALTALVAGFDVSGSGNHVHRDEQAPGTTHLRKGV